jgi:hypothetical protein
VNSNTEYTPGDRVSGHVLNIQGTSELVPAVTKKKHLGLKITGGMVGW